MSPLDEVELGMMLLPYRKTCAVVCTKTKLLLITARSETSKADLIPIKPALFYPISLMGAGSKGDAAPSTDPEGQQLQGSALEPCLSLQHLLLGIPIT